MKQHIIARVLRVSPSQSELFRRNKSRIFIGVEGESMIDTIIQQAHRDLNDFINIADRAIAEAGLSEEYGELRVTTDPVLSLFGIAHLSSTQWLRDEDDNVYDLFISIEPTDIELGEPNVDIIDMRVLENHIEGENPLILSADVETLMGMSSSDLRNEDRETSTDDKKIISSDEEMIKVDESPNTDMMGNDDRQIGGQGRVKNPETDGRLKSNRESAPARRTQRSDDDEAGQRGRVTSPYDRRLRRNRAAQRRPQNESVSMNIGNLPTWPDGSPRTISQMKLDGTLRKKPGPAKGSRYGARAGN